MPRPSLRLGARLLVHSGRTPDATYAIPPMLQQGASTTILTTLVTVAPYLFHFKALPNSKRGMGKINPCPCDHTLAVTVLLLQDKLQYS